MHKVALITGASRGIGRETARVLSEKGYTVIVNYYRSREAAEQLVAQLRANGGDAEAVCADVGDAAQVSAMIDDVLRRYGRIDALVNNAGIAQQKLLGDVADAEWRRMMAVHVDSVFYTCRAVLPGMIARQSGSIVNISSMWGVVGASCEVPYSTAKAAVIGFTKALAKEVGPSGITVNCVAPGVIDTDMCAGFDEQTRTELAEETPLCRLGTAADVAKAVAFLLSEEAAFITGQTLGVNGGFIV